MSSLVDGAASFPCETLESLASGLELAYRELIAYEMLAYRGFRFQAGGHG